MERSLTRDGRHAIGAAQMCAGMLIIPFLDVFAKLLGASHGPFEITFWRFFMQTALMLPFVVWLGLWRIPPGTLAMQASRGLLLAAATVFFFAALQHLPMAEAIAIFFAQPMVFFAIDSIINDLCLAILALTDQEGDASAARDASGLRVGVAPDDSPGLELSDGAMLS